jgi:predicted phage terminase large subunit-like protein
MDETEILYNDSRKGDLLNSLLYFTRYFHKHLTGQKYITNWHHECICDYLEAVYNGEIKYLIINVPPGASKTNLVVDNFTAWSFAKNEALGIPHPKFIHTSYSDVLVNRNSTNVKNIIKLPAYQELFPVKITKDSAVEWYTSGSQGGFYAVPSAGQVTGFHAGRKIDDGFYGMVSIDDPMKPEDARSDVERTKINRRFNETLMSRLSYPDKTPIVLIMQRLHQKDLTGFLLDGGAGIEFEHLCLPLVDETRKYVNLWSEMWNDTKIESLKKDSYTFAGQYQQNPVPEGGGLIKTEFFKRYTVLPDLDFKIQTVDPALGEKQKNDPTGALTLGKYENKVYIIDYFTQKTDDPAPRLKDYYIKHKPRIVGVESNSIGAGVIKDLKKYDAERNISIPIQAIWQHKDKYQRVQDVLGFIHSGYVYIPEEAEWLSDFLLELEGFPNVEHDEAVDCLSAGLKMLLSDAGQILYPEFQTDLHVKNIEFLPDRPLIFIFNTVGLPAYIACQFTSYGQLRILDCYVQDIENRQLFIERVKETYKDTFPTNSLKLYQHEDWRNKGVSDWNMTFYDELGDVPISFNTDNKLSDIVGVTSRLLTENAVNPQSYKQEPKVIIDNRAVHLIKGFEGMWQKEQPKDAITGLIQKTELRKEHPYIELHNCLSQLIYNYFIDSQIEARGDQRSVTDKIKFR